jgi:hypothetical protein
MSMKLAKSQPNRMVLPISVLGQFQDLPLHLMDGLVKMALNAIAQ